MDDEIRGDIQGSDFRGGTYVASNFPCRRRRGISISRGGERRHFPARCLEVAGNRPAEIAVAAEEKEGHGASRSA